MYRNPKIRYYPPQDGYDSPKTYLLIQHILGKHYCPTCHGKLWSWDFTSEIESDAYIDSLIGQLQMAKIRARKKMQKGWKQFREDGKKRSEEILPNEPIN